MSKSLKPPSARIVGQSLAAAAPVPRSATAPCSPDTPGAAAPADARRVGAPPPPAVVAPGAVSISVRGPAPAPPAWVQHQVSDDALRAFATSQTTAHRFCTTERGWIDRFGDRFLLSVRQKSDISPLTRHLRTVLARVGLPCRAMFVRNLEKNPGQDSIPALMACADSLAAMGDMPDDSVDGMGAGEHAAAEAQARLAEEVGRLTVVENGVRFGIDIAAGYSPGLFLDQRDNRRALQLNPPQRLLNLFAYTCSFSVAAAAAGCKETCSVDLSKKSLDRGRENFRLNDIDFTPTKNAMTGVLKLAPLRAGHGPLPNAALSGGVGPCPPSSRHRFIADDVFRILPYLRKRGETFDAIILDPPTFARGTKVGSFRVERDLPQLLEACMALAAPQCRLLVSVNCSTMQMPTLQRMATAAAQSAGRRFRLAIPAPPADFPGDALPAMLWIQLG
ncbi:hypothetical protein DB346_03470 [Verrucomicrobia bacterium LW23]|nr:hypothetical protein DB346_03470 [Verrucomicrobia bacterium LW23]